MGCRVIVQTSRGLLFLGRVCGRSCLAKLVWCRALKKLFWYREVLVCLSGLHLECFLSAIGRPVVCFFFCCLCVRLGGVRSHPCKVSFAETGTRCSGVHAWEDLV